MALRDALQALLRRETKSSRAGPLVALQHPGRAVWSPRRFDAFAEEAYQKNVIAFRAINQVSRAAASVPWRLAENTERRSRVRHPLLDLLARPNPMMARSEFIEAVTGYYLIAGNAFIEAVGADALGGGGAPPRELWPLRPDRMTVVAGKPGQAWTSRPARAPFNRPARRRNRRPRLARA